MNAELLLEHFHRLGDAPDAVPRLRRFILDLAVRGKLVEQDEQDETALQLLKRIDAAKVQAYKAGEISKPKTVPALDGNDEPYTAPSGWCWTRIRQVTADRGQTIPKKRFTYIDVTAINKEAGVVADAQVLEAADAPSRARKVVGAGDVIYSCVRPYLLNVAVIDHEIKPAPIASTAFAVMHGFGLVVPQYLWIVMRSPFMIACVEDRMRGQAYPSINDADFALLPFPLPPLPEQHRIVAKVDELMALCDRLEAAQQQREAERTRLTAAAWQAVVQAEAPAEVSFALDQLHALTTRPAQVKALRQTILDLAVRGRLVEQEEPYRTPVPLGSVATLQNGYAFKSEWFSKEGTRLLRNANVVHGVLRWDDVVHLPTNLTEQYNRFRLYEGDIVLSLDRPFIATGTKVARVFNHDLPCLLLQRVGRFQLDARALSADYLFMWLHSPAFTSQVNPGRSNGVPHISSREVESVSIYVPPLAEQRRIVAKVEELMALCDGLEAALESTEALRGKALEAVVRPAAGGTLPPAPARVRSLPVPKPPVRYRAPAEAPALAAEPEAALRPAKRGRGRPPKSKAMVDGTVSRIATYLQQHGGWHGKAAILEATGVAASAWNAAIKELLATRKVERQGEKKGARYRGV